MCEGLAFHCEAIRAVKSEPSFRALVIERSGSVPNSTAFVWGANPWLWLTAFGPTALVLRPPVVLALFLVSALALVLMPAARSGAVADRARLRLSLSPRASASHPKRAPCTCLDGDTAREKPFSPERARRARCYPIRQL